MRETLSKLQTLVSVQGSNAELAYSINTISGLRTSDGVSDNISTSTFTINATTAELLVNTDLEREAEMEGYHYYEITVRDDCNITLHCRLVYEGLRTNPQTIS